MISLPTAALGGEDKGRHFLPYLVSQNSEIPKDVTHQRDYRVPHIPAVRDLLSGVLSGPCGDVLKVCLGGEYHVSEITCVVSEPGSEGQYLHADAGWDEGERRRISMFLALTDILIGERAVRRFRRDGVKEGRRPTKGTS